MTTDGGPPSRHAYLSTACFHGEHGACRNTCKYCDAPCSCGGCDHASARDLPEPWVDQARNVAVPLLGALGPDVPGELRKRIASDPGLFWLRGETKPPGEWHDPKAAEDPDRE